MDNLLAHIPEQLPEELFETILEKPGLRSVLVKEMPCKRCFPDPFGRFPASNKTGLDTIDSFSLQRNDFLSILFV